MKIFRHHDTFLVLIVYMTFLVTKVAGRKDDFQNFSIMRKSAKKMGIDKNTSLNAMMPIIMKQNKREPNDLSYTPLSGGASETTTSFVDPFRMLLLGLLVLQNSFAVLIGSHTRCCKHEDELYSVNHFIIVCEILKLLVCLVMEYVSTNGMLLKSIKLNVIDDPVDCLKVFIPSIMYLIQNTLVYVALSHLDAPLFQVTFQAKLLISALISSVMLNRRYTSIQWVSLASLGVGVAVAVLGKNGESFKISSNSDNLNLTEGKGTRSIMTGLAAVIISCTSSSFAGVYIEKILKGKPVQVQDTKESGKVRIPVSLWMRNIQMAMISIFIAFVHDAMNKGIGQKKAFLHGFTNWVWILLVLRAGGGLLVAAVMKYTDSILKGLATGISVVVSSIMSMVIFGTPITGSFAAGAIIILLSAYVFSNDIPVAKNTKSK